MVLVLKLSVPSRATLPFTASRLVVVAPRKILSVLPEFSVRPPMLRVPEGDPVPGAMVPPFATVTAEFVAAPVPEKMPPFTEIAPAPLLVPERRSVPAFTAVAPE